MNESTHETSSDQPIAAFGQGPPPASGWKSQMHDDPTEYSPEFQDEYRRLWHETAAERDRLREALTKIAGHTCYSAGSGYVDVKVIAKEALANGD